MAIGPVALTAKAAGPRALPAGQELPQDKRLQPLKDLDGYFPFQPPAEAKPWQRRAAEVRRRLLVANGLWPLPTKTPLNAVVHGRVERDDYTVEKAYFESFPGFFVTGNLYRPRGKSGKHPGVLCPHGHWSNGRFYDAGEAATQQAIEQGGEKFAEGGRSPLQARCVQLARMGCVDVEVVLTRDEESVTLYVDRSDSIWCGSFVTNFEVKVLAQRRATACVWRW